MIGVGHNRPERCRESILLLSLSLKSVPDTFIDLTRDRPRCFDSSSEGHKAVRPGLLPEGDEHARPVRGQRGQAGLHEVYLRLDFLPFGQPLAETGERDLELTTIEPTGRPHTAHVAIVLLSVQYLVERVPPWVRRAAAEVGDLRQIVPTVELLQRIGRVGVAEVRADVVPHRCASGGRTSDYMIGGG